MIWWHPAQPASSRDNTPQDGRGFLAYGRHARDEGRPGRYKAGDHWWAILQWDIWREPHQFVFAKDGAPFDWGDILAWAKLDVPGSDVMHGLEPGLPLPWPPGPLS